MPCGFVMSEIRIIFAPKLKTKHSMEKVFKIDGQWIYCEYECPVEGSNNTQVYDTIKAIGISDQGVPQVCILGHNGKYGIYTLDGCYGQSGPGKYFNPTDKAFPYDEVLLHQIEYGICYAAFRIGDKWGIEKIVDVGYTSENFTHNYTSTRRKTVVPCEFDSLEAAQSQIISWHDFREESHGYPITL